VAFDRPGIGQSDPQLKRNLNTSAEDMADIADALGMGKFWVFAHSGGAPYAWAALHYIPTRLAGNRPFFSLRPFNVQYKRD
jgi:pimeloyl-ACP methyl ester carboxylesterase